MKSGPQPFHAESSLHQLRPQSRTARRALSFSTVDLQAERADVFLRHPTAETMEGLGFGPSRDGTAKRPDAPDGKHPTDEPSPHKANTSAGELLPVLKVCLRG